MPDLHQPASLAGVDMPPVLHPAAGYGIHVVPAAGSAENAGA